MGNGCNSNPLDVTETVPPVVGPHPRDVNTASSANPDQETELASHVILQTLIGLLSQQTNPVLGEVCKSLADIQAQQRDILEALKTYGIAVGSKPRASRPIAETLDEFQEHLKNGNRRRESTCRDYQRDVRQFVQFLANNNREASTASMTSENVYDFAMALTKDGQSDTSVERKVYGVMAYWKFLARRKLADPPPDLEEIGLYFKRTTKQQRVLTREEFERLCTPRMTSTTSTF
jgi:hypothetical protein